MARDGISLAELARKIGCGASALTVLFRTQTKQSRLVPAIHKELGRPPPSPVTAPSTITASDEVLRKINRYWPLLSKEQRDLVNRIVEQLVGIKH
jgi:hypothetical protein